MSETMLSSGDVVLLEKARDIIRKRYHPERHTVGSALRTRSGRVFAAVHLEAHVGRVAVCAEAIALGMAAAEGDTDIDTIVAVDEHGAVVSPCGMCREMISDYSPQANVVILIDEGLAVVPIRDLLPYKYQATRG